MSRDASSFSTECGSAVFCFKHASSETIQNAVKLLEFQVLFSYVHRQDDDV